MRCLTCGSTDARVINDLYAFAGTLGLEHPASSPCLCNACEGHHRTNLDRYRRIYEHMLGAGVPSNQADAAIVQMIDRDFGDGVPSN